MLQPDGKIVAAGGEAGGDFALARYNPNGSLDTSFSGNGRTRTDFGDNNDLATGVALQADGKIVAVGRSGFGDVRARPLQRERVARLELLRRRPADHHLLRWLWRRGSGCGAPGIGKIVVVGLAAGTGGGDFALARYNANGSPDTSFSGDGKQTTDFFGDYDQANGVALQGDGKIVVAGSAGRPGGSDFALARYNTNGSPDTSFSGDGKQTSGFGGAEFASGVALQGDGKIVAVGPVFRGGRDDFALARYNANGSPDTSFSGDGKQTTGFSQASDFASDVALQADGKIVAVGSSGGGEFAVARYNANGSLDPGFSGDGKQTTAFGGSDSAGGVALQGNGKTVAVGSGAGDFALARYAPNGSLDPSFSGDGKQTTDFAGSGGEDGANGVALQPDGKIVVAGMAAGTLGGGAASRSPVYNADGSPDTSFSSDGRKTVDFGDSDEATAVALQADGKIVAVGRSGSGDFAIARFNANGSLDTSFSGDGRKTASFGDFEDGATGVALQENGKIVAVGGRLTGGDYDFALARFNANGSLDTSFSGNGKQTTDFGGFDAATGVAIQANGKIVVVGSGGAGDGDFALARFNANGSLDTSFSGNGKQTTDFGVSDAASGVALQGDRKIVAVGVASTCGPEGCERDFALARYNPNGSLDPNFSGDGRQTSGFDGGASGVALQADGRIVAVGTTCGECGPDFPDSDFVLARYNPNGSLETNWTTDFVEGFEGDSDRATGVVIQTDGRIVAVGAAARNFALARYLGG